MLKNYQVIHKQTNDSKSLTYEEIRKIVLNETNTNINKNTNINNNNTNNDNKPIRNKFNIV